MNKLKIGYNFTDELLHYLCNIDSTNNVSTVTEVYGSRQESSYLTARPRFRLPDISRENFKYHVKTLADSGISFNYTLNANTIGSKSYINQHKAEIKNYIRFLGDSGVKIITVSIPLIAELIRSVNEKIEIELSAIANLESVTQAMIWKETYGINRICGSVHKNRKIKFLRNLSNYCEKNGIILTLIVNEFCGNGFSNENTVSATNCIYSNHCYLLHSLDYNICDELEHNYPMNYCVASRSNNLIWLKMCFIRPEDMKLYNGIGIDHFKVTGRTGSTEFIKFVLQAYTEGCYNGNLLDLWKHIETINLNSEKTFNTSFYLDNNLLDGFANHWFENENHSCSDVLCGITCKYCDEFYNAFVKNCGRMTCLEMDE